MVIERGRMYRDRSIPGRRLEVTEVVEGDRLGREVRGVLHIAGGGLNDGREYSTDVRTFKVVWRPVRRVRRSMNGQVK